MSRQVSWIVLCLATLAAPAQAEEAGAPAEVAASNPSEPDSTGPDGARPTGPATEAVLDPCPPSEPDSAPEPGFGFVGFLGQRAAWDLSLCMPNCSEIGLCQDVCYGFAAEDGSDEPNGDVEVPGYGYRSTHDPLVPGTYYVSYQGGAGGECDS